MKMNCQLYCLFSVICLVACEPELNPYDLVSTSIPAPTPETIVYNSIRDDFIHLRVSSDDYSRSFRLTSSSLATTPDWSPDKQWVAYKQDFQIWKMRYDGSDKRALTPSGISAEVPRFSSDGRRLVFVVALPDYGYTLYTMSNDGGQRQQVISDGSISTSGRYSFIWPDWSSDGRKICFSYVRLDTSFLQSYIGILDPTNRSFVRLPWFDQNLLPVEPRWSPKRDELLVTCGMRSGGRDIWRVNVDGTNPTRLTYTGRGRAPEWSSDGEKFLFESRSDSIRTTWSMKRDGTGAHQILIEGDPYVGNATW